ncbi:MAG: sulfur carrier protein ThiS [Oscillospiraceae bacterium]|nr:sulfur carrier protein ThiS [Oscillospiraceae bacterium]
MIKINGEIAENIAGKNVAEYLTESSYDLKRVAVELNGNILPKSQYENTLLQDGDNVEIVSFVGGG